jgi:hypothetical protein
MNPISKGDNSSPHGTTTPADVSLEIDLADLSLD